MDSFPNEIKRIRQECLLSQEAFAQSIGVSFTTVNRWESGKSKPNYKTMKLISNYCRANGISFDAVKTFRGDKNEL